MTNKECFIKLMEELLNDVPDFFNSETEEGQKAQKYFDELKSSKASGGGKAITENGVKIIKFMQENHVKFNNVFSAKSIGEGIFSSGRSAASSMKKLIADGYATKEGKDPVMYSLTEAGKNLQLD